MATITIEVPEERLKKLREAAALMGVSPEELVKRTMEEIVEIQDREFEAMLDYLLKKNEELLRRLA